MDRSLAVVVSKTVAYINIFIRVQWYKSSLDLHKATLQYLLPATSFNSRQLLMADVSFPFTGQQLWVSFGLISLVPTSNIRIIRIISIIIILNISISFLCSSGNGRKLALASFSSKLSAILNWTDPKVLDLDFNWPKHNDPVASLCFSLWRYYFRVPTTKKSDMVVVEDNHNHKNMVDHFPLIMITIVMPLVGTRLYHNCGLYDWLSIVMLFYWFSFCFFVLG